MSELPSVVKQTSSTRSDPLFEGIKAAGYTGACGLVFGGVTAVLKSSPTPKLWTLATGVQWALLGGSYWGIREAFLKTQIRDQMTPGRHILASTISGCASFILVGAITRGRANIVPGAIMGSLLGASGQYGVNAIQNMKQRPNQSTTSEASLWSRILDSPWSPVHRLTDEQYAKIINDKIFKVDVEIALVDDEIAALRANQQITDKESEK